MSTCLLYIFYYVFQINAIEITKFHYRYSYDYGLAHYIMISTEHDFSPGSPMYTWLENDLKIVDRKKTPWVIIAGHRAMYCSSAIASKYQFIYVHGLKVTQTAFNFSKSTMETAGNVWNLF